MTYPTLTRGSHPSHDPDCCLLEAVSLRAGEPKSDKPESVLPVLARLGVAANDRMCHHHGITNLDAAPICVECQGVLWAYGTVIEGTAAEVEQIVFPERMSAAVAWAAAFESLKQARHSTAWRTRRGDAPWDTEAALESFHSAITAAHAITRPDGWGEAEAIIPARDSAADTLNDLFRARTAMTSTGEAVRDEFRVLDNLGDAVLSAVSSIVTAAAHGRRRSVEQRACSAVHYAACAADVVGPGAFAAVLGAAAGQIEHSRSLGKEAM